MGKRRINEDQEEEKAKDATSQEDILQVMKNFYENITSLIRNSFEKHIEVLQREVFDIKIQQDKDREKIHDLQRENGRLQEELQAIPRRT